MSHPLSLDPHALDCLRQAGRVASDVRDAGARLIAAGARVRDVCVAVEEEIARRGAGCAVHGPRPIPNAADLAGGRLRAGAVVAIEPFVTDGPGVVAEHGEPQVFRLDPRREPAEGPDPEALAAVRAFHGLPFARRQLAAYAGPRLEGLLRWLLEEGGLMSYAPLRETAGHAVAQAEHTVYVGP